jgi:dienelactone hydrolase
MGYPVEVGGRHLVGLKRVALFAVVGASVAFLAGATQASPPSAAYHLVAPDGRTSLDIFEAQGTLAGRQATVVVAPGWNCTDKQYTDVTRFLTSRGYTVAVFAHDDNGDETVAFWDLWLGEALDALIAADANPKSPIAFTIDKDKLAIVGHSLGAAASARFASHDKRFKAVVISAPQAREKDFLYSAKGIEAAILAIDGSLDHVAPPDQCSQVIVDAAASKYSARVVVKNGNHENCPADFNDDYVYDQGRWMVAFLPFPPFAYWKYAFPIVPGLKPIPGADQRKISYPFLGAWLDRFVAGKKSDRWTTGVEADAELQSGVLSEESFNAAARSGH